MRQSGTEREDSLPRTGEPSRWMLDPLEDGVDDEAVILTRREIVRITLVATEVGARFQREGIRTDPMAWLLTPRRLFRGRPPIEACTSRDDCARAVLVHGLGLELDVSAEAMNGLMEPSTAPNSEWIVPAG